MLRMILETSSYSQQSCIIPVFHSLVGKCGGLWREMYNNTVEGLQRRCVGWYLCTIEHRIAKNLASRWLLYLFYNEVWVQSVRKLHTILCNAHSLTSLQPSLVSFLPYQFSMWTLRELCTVTWVYIMNMIFDCHLALIFSQSSGGVDTTHQYRWLMMLCDHLPTMSHCLTFAKTSNFLRNPAK